MKPSDFAFATRQQGHFKKDFKPLTARFWHKDTVEKNFHAARVAGMVNRRREVAVGKHRTPKQVLIDGEEKQASAALFHRAEERPQTYIRRSRTEAEREKDKATRIFRESERYKDSQDVRNFVKKNKIDFAGMEDGPETEDESNEEEYGTPRSSASSTPAEATTPSNGVGGSGTANGN